MTEIKTIGIIGGGTMGNGIVHVAAKSGLKVILLDIEPRFVDRALATIRKEHGPGSREKQDLRVRQIRGISTQSLPPRTNAAMAEADFIVEAVIENLDLKSKIFSAMDEIARPGVILASNTSSISITKIASGTKRPDKVIGMHFMNPVPVMALVEIVRGLATSDETYRVTSMLAEAMGKTPVEVNDYPGFVSNRILMPMINEAIFCVMEGVGTPEAIDQVMKLGMNHPIGPLALADLIGLDVCLNIMEVLQGGLGDPKYRACPLLRKMVDAGHLGRKSGRGFYQY